MTTTRAAAAPLVAAVLGSLALSLAAVWQDPVINRDGVLYLLAARLLAAGDWQAALALHPLPGYPLLLAGASLLPGLGAESAAHGVNAALSAGLAAGFVTLVGRLDPRTAARWLAVLLVLAWASGNDYRSELIRDHGYLCLVMGALLALLAGHRRPNWRPALGWTVLILGATLFRAEAIVLALLWPLLLAFGAGPGGARGRGENGVAGGGWPLWLRFGAPPLLAGALAAGLLAAAGALDGFAVYADLARERWQAGLVERTAAFVESLALPGGHVAELAPLLLLAWLVVLALAALVQALTPAYTLLALAVLRRAPSGPTGRLVLGGIGAQVLVLCAGAGVLFFVSARYALLPALLLLALLPGALLDAAARWRRARPRRWALVAAPAALLVAALVYTTADGVLDSGRDKLYLRAAGSWLVRQLPPQARVQVNDDILWHYAQRADTRPPRARPPRVPAAKMLARLRGGGSDGYDYVAIRFDREEPPPTAAPRGWLQCARFAGRGEVRIYARSGVNCPQAPSSQNRRSAS